MDEQRTHYVTFEIDTPARAAELATLAAAAGFGYASVGTCPPQEGTTLGIPTSEARWIVSQTLAKLRETGGDALELVERLLAKPEYALVPPHELGGSFGKKEDAVLAVMEIEETTGRFVANRYREKRDDWRDLVVEWERTPTTRYRLSSLARQELTRAKKTAGTA